LPAFALYLEIIRVASAVSRSIEDLCNKSTIFTMQYARSYYGKPQQTARQLLPAGGWDFPGDDEPHYKDFLYFSFGIGMTCRRCRCADRFSFDEVYRAFSLCAVVLF
jgi:hypothetical protein